MTLPFHPLANIFPMMSAQEHEDLVADMRANGYRAGEEIVLLDGAILDGRNRYRAAVEVGLIPADFDPLTDTGQAGWLFSKFSDEGCEGLLTAAEVEAGPLAYVIAKNLRRRHLNETQRAMVAARLANLEHGQRADRAANLPVSDDGHAAVAPVTQADAAQMLNVSERSVRAAKAVQEAGSTELIAAVDRGQLAVSAAAQATKLDPEQQRAVAKAAADGQANVVRSVIKRGTRAAREERLAERQEALPQKKYGVILADPEWRFTPYSRDTGMDRAPENHYPTSSTAAIAARGVPDIAADDCALFLCATAPMLLDAIDVLKRWGFVYKTHAVWAKKRAGKARGPGFWFTGEHELVLLGIKGQVPAPAEGTQWRSILEAPVGRHSEKPDIIREMIEAYFPNLPKIELNRRGPPRAGWDAWGDEAELPPHDPETGEIISSDPSRQISGDPSRTSLATDQESARDGSDAEPCAAATVAAEEGGGGGPEAAAPQRSPRPPQDDGLDIPAFLRRTLVPAAAPAGADEGVDGRDNPRIKSGDGHDGHDVEAAA